MNQELSTGLSMEKILQYEREVAALPQADHEVTHHFAEGVYARELFIPKGVTAVGKIHKYRNLNFLAQGDISVSTEQGIRRVQAPFIVVSPPGTKRVVYAHEDCIWVTIHGTKETDLEVIEEQFTADTPEDFQRFLELAETEEQPCLGGR